MKNLATKAKNNWKFKQRVSRFNQWFFGPVLVVNIITLFIAVNMTDLHHNYERASFWEATGQTIMTVMQAIGLVSVG